MYKFKKYNVNLFFSFGMKIVIVKIFMKAAFTCKIFLIFYSITVDIILSFFYFRKMMIKITIKVEKPINFTFTANNVNIWCFSFIFGSLINNCNE